MNLSEISYLFVAHFYFVTGLRRLRTVRLRTEHVFRGQLFELGLELGKSYPCPVRRPEITAQHTLALRYILTLNSQREKPRF